MIVSIITHFIDTTIIKMTFFKLEYMDEDIRAALFDDRDSDGSFEELDDDFILQVNNRNLIYIF